MPLYKNYLVGIIVSENAALEINKTEIKGNKDFVKFKTIGILSQKSNLIIKDCKIYNFSLGGVIFWTQEQNLV